MTQSEDTQRPAPGQPEADPHDSGEVLISGLDTGPDEGNRQNRSPTVKLIGLQPESADEPDDEDG